MKIPKNENPIKEEKKKSKFAKEKQKLNLNRDSVQTEEVGEEMKFIKPKKIVKENEQEEKANEEEERRS